MFTFAEMKKAHAQHGNVLVWVTDDGVFSANPRDYFRITDDSTKLEGELMIRIPEQLEPLIK